MAHSAALPANHAVETAHAHHVIILCFSLAVPPHCVNATDIPVWTWPNSSILCSHGAGPRLLLTSLTRSLTSRSGSSVPHRRFLTAVEVFLGHWVTRVTERAGNADPAENRTEAIAGCTWNTVAAYPLGVS